MWPWEAVAVMPVIAVDVFDGVVDPLSEEELQPATPSSRPVAAMATIAGLMRMMADP
jgi:hypothetical protein